MGKRDARVDEYIKKSADFAKPILVYLRDVVHATCPDTEETLKWGMPSFMYDGILCGMAAFKQHCTFGFWKHALIMEGADSASREAMGSFGRITSLKDLPPKKVLVGYIKKAMALNEAGTKVAKPKRPPKKPLPVPPVLTAALKRNAKARKNFESFPPSHRREYIEWITEAKTDATRDRRLATTVEWLAEGKQRNWKYMDC